MKLTRFSMAAALAALIACGPLAAQDQEPGQPVEQARDQQQNTQERERKPRRRSLFPDDISGLEQLAQTAYEEGNYLRYLQAHIKLRQKEPYNPEYLRGMVYGFALLERSSSAYNYMLQMQQQGLSYDLSESEKSANIRGTEVFDYLNDLMIRAGDPVGEAETVIEISSDLGQPGGLDWDAAGSRFIAGSRDDGSIHGYTEDGDSEMLVGPGTVTGLASVRGLNVDESNGRLWVSGVADEANGALFEFDLSSMELISRYDTPSDDAAHQPGAVQVSAQGHVFVVDEAASQVLVKAVGTTELAPFFSNPELGALKDLAIRSDGQRLYVADAVAGILAVDMKNQVTALLTGPETLNQHGISSIVAWADKLAMFQTGISPQRVMRLDVDPVAGAITSVAPMAIALAAWNKPAFGVVRGDKVYYIANAATPASEGQPYLLQRTPLDSGEEIVPPDMRKFEEETLSRARDKKE